MRSVAPDSLMKQIAAATAPVIVDVRSATEFAEGHVPGAIHLPFWQVGPALAEAGVDARVADRGVLRPRARVRTSRARRLRRRGFRMSCISPAI